MPHNAETLKYERLDKYPHMRPRDVEIWDKYIALNPEDFMSVRYDVKVGEPELPGEDISDAVINDWRDLCRWGIDAVAEDEFAIYAIEVKPNATAGALGQAVAYAKLLEIKWKPKKPVIPAVVTDHISDITAQAANAMGVEVWIP